MIETNLPYMQLKRLVIVTHTGQEAYNEEFHEGLNIIRGKNSSGKSTIANFIFYALGGDFTNWTKQALACRSVYAEVSFNGVTITLNREVSESPRRPMDFFWGTYEEASVSKDYGWMTFPFSQSDNKTSFSNVIFNALSLPETRNEEGGKITMHQILRLLYLDQDTPVQNLFRLERFDFPITREAVAELLLGVYDDDLYHNRIQLKEKEKQFDDKSRDIKSIREAFKLAGNSIQRSHIEKQLEIGNEKLTKNELEIDKLKQASKARTTKTPLEVEKLQSEMNSVQNQIRVQMTDVNNLSTDIADSKLFISTLEKRVKAIDESILVKNSFGDLPLSHCPQCLSLLSHETEHGKCNLCHNKLPDDVIKSSSLRIKQELLLQIEESTRVMERRRAERDLLDAELSKNIDYARLKQREIDLIIKYSDSTRDIKINQLYTEKGSIESMIEYYIEQRKSVELIEKLEEEVAELKKTIQILKLKIDGAMSAQRARLNDAKNEISTITRGILSADLKRQDEFINPGKINVDFRKDTFSIDNVNYFSASSNTVFKNAVSFGIFFSSLIKDYFRYPRFIICDNVEDKGMEETRSKNFQRIIYELSSNASVKHQIIMTTSMIDESLNAKEELLVGEYYTNDNRTLKVDRKVPAPITEPVNA